MSITKNQKNLDDPEVDQIPIFIYFRISTKLQNFKAQNKIIKNYLDQFQQKYNIIDTFRDEDKSGALGPDERPQFKEMINRLKEVKAILCYDWDRISRDYKFATKFMFELEENEVSIIEANTGKILNFDEMGDRIWTYLKSEMASDERERIKRRQKAGIEAFKEEYDRWGPTKKYGGGPDGTKWGKEKFWKKYRTLRLANVSKSAIARLFNLSRTTLYDRLDEEKERYKKIEAKVKEKYEIKKGKK